MSKVKATGNIFIYLRDNRVLIRRHADMIMLFFCYNCLYIIGEGTFHIKAAHVIFYILHKSLNLREIYC